MAASNPIRQTARWIAGTAIGISALGLPYLWESHSEIRRITQVWYRGEVNQFTRNWRELDQHMQDAAGQGNVVLRFEGFDPANSIVQEACWRGAYAVYPRLVLAADDGVVINNAGDVLSAGFNPSLQWMQEHNVRASLRFIASGNGGFRIQAQAIPPAGGR